MGKTYLLLGGNIGDRIMHLRMARQKVHDLIGKPVSVSSVFETQPWGFVHKTNFLNQLIIVRTFLSPEQVMEKIREIEQHLGRIRDEKQYTERTIDIDILFYDDLILNKKDLTIPHPQLHKRSFALVPLAELEPGLVHPVFKKTIKTLLNECPDTMKVNKQEGLSTKPL